MAASLYKRWTIKNWTHLALTLTLFVVAATSWAQTDAGKIVGTITDSSGAVVPGTAVTATNEATGVAKQATANESGNYTFPALAPGSYSIEAVAKGFEKSKQKGIVLDASATRNVVFQMVVGQVTQEVVVESVAQSQVENTNAQITSTITSEQIENISLNGRNYVQLMRLLPGTVSATLDPFSIQLGAMSTYVNGIRGASILNMADGVILEDIGANISVFAVPNADSISETRVLGSSYSADNPSPYGGATINAITKSGAHDFHGDTWEYNRNTIFNAKQDFANPLLSKPPLHFNDFGYTLGGPVFIPGKFNTGRNKLFFFNSEEWKYIHQGNITTGLVPTANQKMGIFTNPVYQPGTKNLYPANSCTQNTAVQNNAATGYCIPQSAWSVNGPLMLKAFLAPNTAGTGNNYTTILPTNLDNREDRINLDYAATANDLVNLRWAENTNVATTAAALGIIPKNVVTKPSTLISLGYTRTFSPRLLNTLMVGETHNTYTTAPDLQNVLLSTLGMNNFAAKQPFANTVFATMPNLTISGSGCGPTGTSSCTAITGYNKDTKTVVNLLFTDDLSWVKGNHTFKFGAYMQHAKDDEHNLTSTNTNGALTFTASGTTLTTGNALGDVLMGNFNAYSQSSIPGFFLMRYMVTEAYAQDNWHATRKLALEYGVRYSFSQLPYEAINNTSFFNPAVYSAANAPCVSSANGSLSTCAGSAAYNPYNGMQIVGSGWGPNAKAFFPNLVNNTAVNALFSGSSRGFAPTPKGDFAPRVGIAYDPFGDGKTSIRLGYGIFFMRQNTFEYSAATQNLPFNSQVALYNGIVDNVQGAAGRVNPTSVYTIPTSYTPAYVQTRNAGFQRQLPGFMILDVNYVGNVGLHMPTLVNINQLQPGTLTNPANKGVNPNALRTYKGYADIDQQSYTDTTNYNSLQVTLGRRVSRGLNFNVSYTWSKTMEGTSQNLPASVLPMNSYNVKADHSVADINRGQVINGNLVYKVPFFAHNEHAVVKQALSGWSLSGVSMFQQGAPINVTMPVDQAGISTATGTGGMSQRPNIVPGVSPYTHQNCSGMIKFSGYGVCQYLNPAAFALPAAGTFGNASRNYVTGPHYLSTDISVFKNFKFTDHIHSEFRAESFNAFNHDSLTTIGSSINPSSPGNFGQVTATAPGRVLQFGAKVMF